MVGLHTMVLVPNVAVINTVRVVLGTVEPNRCIRVQLDIALLTVAFPAIIHARNVRQQLNTVRVAHQQLVKANRCIRVQLDMDLQTVAFPAIIHARNVRQQHNTVRVVLLPVRTNRCYRVQLDMDLQTAVSPAIIHVPNVRTMNIHHQT